MTDTSEALVFVLVLVFHVRDDGHVAKVERRLEPSIHARTLEKVEERVGVDEKPSATAAEE